MPVRTSYAQGTPNWVDLQTPDQDAAKAFYAGLFGWTYDDQPMGEGQVYSMAMLGGHQVVAISPQPPEMAAAGAPPPPAAPGGARRGPPADVEHLPRRGLGGRGHRQGRGRGRQGGDGAVRR